MTQLVSPLSTLRLSLLGAPRIRLDDRTVTGFISSKAEALLFYLAVEEGVHARHDLADLLWPDSAGRQSLKNLRDVLTNLRRLLGDYLEISRDTAALRRDVPYWLDVEAFSAATSGQHLTAHAEALTAALKLYRGDFLGSFYVSRAPEFEQWADSVREQMRQQAINGLQTLAEHHLAAQDFASGLDVNGRLLSIEPWYEAGHRQRMRLLALSGQRTAALRQYDICREILAMEFGIEPLPETRQLADAIAAGELAPAAEAPGAVHVPLAAVPARSVRPGYLPRVLTPFFGRSTTLMEIARKVQDPDYPLVTIVGQGGVGKTRLALAAAAQAQPTFEDGAWFVDLTHVTLSDDDVARAVWDNLATAVAHAMQIPFRGARSSCEQLFEALRRRHCLIILDNFEQLVHAAPFVLQLLDAAQRVHVIVTSRAELPLRAAWNVRLEGMCLPESAEMVQVQDPEALVARYAALQLFAERATRQQPDFRLTADMLPHVVTICRLVGGLPLGIELAGALLRQYDVVELATQLGQTLDLLTSASQDVPARHHSLKATFETSWQLLSHPERRALALCTAFRGSFAAEDAALLTGTTPATLEALAAQSLLQDTEAGRYRMNVVIRRSALNKLATQPEDEHEIMQRHGRYYMRFLHERDARMMHDPAAIREVRAELDNVQAAWTWACAARDLTALAHGARTLSDTYQWSGLFHAGAVAFAEAERALRAALAESARPPAARHLLGLLLLERSFFIERLGDIDTAMACAQEALQLGELLDSFYLQATGLLRIAALEWRLGNLAGMRAEAERGLALAERGELSRQQTVAQIGLGLLAMAENDHARALERLNAARALAERDNLQRFASTIHLNLGLSLLEVGELAAAASHYERSAALHARFDDKNGEDVALTGMASILIAWGQYARAEAMLDEIRHRLAQNNDRYYLSLTLRLLAFTRLGRGNYGAAQETAAEALQLARDSQFHPEVAHATLLLGLALVAQGDATGARQAFAQVLDAEPTWGTQPLRQYARAGLADLLLREGDVAGALAEIEPVLPALGERPFNPYYHSAEVSVICCRVLQAARDPRAGSLLESAYAAVQRIAAATPDAATRASFLQEVPANREIVALFTAVGEE